MFVGETAVVVLLKDFTSKLWCIKPSLIHLLEQCMASPGMPVPKYIIYKLYSTFFDREMLMYLALTAFVNISPVKNCAIYSVYLYSLYL